MIFWNKMEIERRLAKVGVEGSNPFARSRFLRGPGLYGRALRVAVTDAGAVPVPAMDERGWCFNKN